MPRSSTRDRADPLAVRDAIARRDAAKVLPSVRYPHRLEQDYQRRLLAYVARLDVTSKLLAVLKRLGPGIDQRHDEQVAANRSEGAKKAARTRRADSAATDTRALLRVVRGAAVQAKAAGVPSSLGPGYQGRVVRAADGQATAQIDQAVKEVTRVAVFHDALEDELFRGYARENVNLIKSLSQDYFVDLERDISTALREGKNTRELVKQIQSTTGATKSRAELIARDQIGKLNGQINEARQTELGLTKYQWSTSGDERVRSSHASLEGSIQEWSSPPVESAGGARNHPGEAISCRCTAEPVLDDDNIEELIAAGEERKSVAAMRRA